MTVVRHPRWHARGVAMALASQGTSVFPCSGSTKRPCTDNGFHDAVRSAHEADRLFSERPGELIGVPTGPANGFDVLDYDPRHGGHLWFNEHRHRLPTTRKHSTRGGGEHLLFKHHPGIRNSESKIAEGVDVRGEGGYIIYWPAHGFPMTSESAIADWPDWLLTILIPPPAPPRETRSRRHDLSNSDATTRRIIARALDRVVRAAPGQRHYALRAASCTLGGLLDVIDVPASTIARDLLDAVIEAGGGDVDVKNAEATIAWGLQKGAASPLSLGGRNAR